MHSFFPVAVLAVGAVFSAAADFMPLGFGRAANVSRRDEIAGDRRGGWLDKGVNDLRLLPDGLGNYAGIDFEVMPCTDENSPSAIIVGGGFPRRAEIAVADGVRGDRLYLLHANDGHAKRLARVGAVTVSYRDGSEDRFEVRDGVENASWTTGRNLDNGVRAWTIYNNYTQVSLFASAFELKALEIAKVVFEAAGEARWMIAAATVGHIVTPRRMVVERKLERKYDFPPRRKTPLRTFPPGAKPKNILFFMGDGMGAGANHLASYYLHGVERGLDFQQLPYAGLCTTFSASGDVTDSAAAATAFATGHKTANGTLGMDPSHRVAYRSIAKIAHDRGKAVGVMTTEGIVGASTAIYYANAADRGLGESISVQLVESGFEFFCGDASYKHCDRLFGDPSYRKDGRDLSAELTAGGYQICRGQAEMDRADPERKVFAFRSFPAERDLGDATRCAIARLSKDADGFFLFCEGALPDGGGHGNNPEKSVLGVVQVDWAVHAALEFAENRDDTLIVVSADHETGALIVNRGTTGKVAISYNSTSHTAAPVELFAFGPGAERFEGLIDNTDIFRHFADLVR